MTDHTPTDNAKTSKAPELLGDKEAERLLEHLNYLKLPAIAEHYEALTKKACQDGWSHVYYLAQLIELESEQRQERATQRRIKAAHFPVIKTLEQFQWSWPKTINTLQVKEQFRLQFMKRHANIILLGGVGLGKTHLATALGHHAAISGKTVLFTNTIDAINSLIIAKRTGRLKAELRRYLKPQLLILDLC